MTDPAQPPVADPGDRSDSARTEATSGAGLPPEARVHLPPSSLAPRRTRSGAAGAVGATGVTEHPGVLVAVLVTALVLPLLLISRQSAAGARDQAGSVQVRTTTGPTEPASSLAARRAAVLSARVTPVALHVADTIVAAHTAVTSPPTTAWVADTATATVAAPDPTPTTVWSPPTTAAPTTAAPTTVAPPAPKTSGGSESGLASYYAHNPGGCASRTIPRGTTVTVTAGNGKSASCVVDDYGPFGAGRIIDLSEEVFAQLADLGAGVISVTVTW